MQHDLSPFRLFIFDFGVGRKQAWAVARDYSVLKPSGKYITFSGNNPEMQIHNLGQAIGFMGSLYGRMLGSGCWPLSPQYIWHNGLDLKPGMLRELLQLVKDRKLKVVHDPISPLPFTLDGILQGFHLMNARHAHGKVVVNMSS